MAYEDAPRVNWPNRTCGQKFVQIEVDGEPYLRFGESTLDFHSEILRDFLSEFGLEHKMMPSIVNRTPIPATIGENYIVRGMGHSLVVSARKLVKIRDRSEDYGMVPDQNHLDQIHELEPGWSFVVAQD